MRGDTAIGHVDAHNELRDGILREAERFGVPVDIGGPFVVGDPGHIPQHNKLVVALQHIADTAGIKVDLPPAHKLGDTGHVTDHDKLNAALAAIEKADAWNDATGGVITDFTADGKRYRCHTFTESTTCQISRAVRPFRVLVVAAGQGGGSDMSRVGGAGGGSSENKALTLAAGSYPVTLSGDSNAFGLSAQMGQGGGGGAPGDGPSQGAIGAPGGAGYTSDITGQPVEYGHGGHGGGGQNSQCFYTPGGPNGNGGHGSNWSGQGCYEGGHPGVVVLTYQIGVAA